VQGIEMWLWSHHDNTKQWKHGFKHWSPLNHLELEILTPIEGNHERALSFMPYWNLGPLHKTMQMDNHFSQQLPKDCLTKANRSYKLGLLMNYRFFGCINNIGYFWLGCSFKQCKQFMPHISSIMVGPSNMLLHVFLNWA
jgi:hypothetical protein